MWCIMGNMQITSWKKLVIQTFFGVSNKISLILVTRFPHNELWNVGIKTFGSPSKNNDEREKGRRKNPKRMAITKAFSLHANTKTKLETQ